MKKDSLIVNDYNPHESESLGAKAEGIRQHSIGSTNQQSLSQQLKNLDTGNS
jgi:hypothetical protein